MDKFKVCKYYVYGNCYAHSGYMGGVLNPHITMGCDYTTKYGNPSKKQVECKDYEPYEKEEKK